MLAGVLAKYVVPGEGPGGVIGDIVIGIVGAFIGGFVFNAFGHVGVDGLNLYSLLVAFVGAAVLLFILRAVSGRTRVVTGAHWRWTGAQTQLTIPYRLLVTMQVDIHRLPRASKQLAANDRAQLERIEALLRRNGKASADPCLRLLPGRDRLLLSDPGLGSAGDAGDVWRQPVFSWRRRSSRLGSRPGVAYVQASRRCLPRR